MMTLTEYIVRASAAWFVGFFPLAEIYVAVPAALAAGLDPVSVVFWTVFGNFTPVLLIHFFYEQLIRLERIRRWFDKLVSEDLKAKLDRYSLWFILIITPWTGVWVMAVTAKVLKLEHRTLFVATLVSITVYAIALVVLIQSGISALTS
jgi:uncharacterized membrane protein